MGWQTVASVALLALCCYATGCLAGFCVGRYGWRRPVPLPRVVRRRPADVWPTHAAAELPQAGATMH